MKNRIQFAAPLGLIALSLTTPPLLSRALGQSGAAATPAFDVASIKRSVYTPENFRNIAVTNVDRPVGGEPSINPNGPSLLDGCALSGLHSRRS